MAATIAITPDYRLTADERQYVLQRRHIVDPARNPFKKPLEDGPIREEWRDLGYYSLTADGFARAAMAAVLHEVNAEIGPTTIADYLAALQTETARLTSQIDAAMLPHLGAGQSA